MKIYTGVVESAPPPQPEVIAMGKRKYTETQRALYTPTKRIDIGTEMEVEKGLGDIYKDIVSCK